MIGSGLSLVDCTDVYTVIHLPTLHSFTSSVNIKASIDDMSTRRSFIDFNSIRDLLAQITSLTAMANQASLTVADDTEPLSFTKFPGLPPEIRLMVWELLLPDRRIVSIDQNYSLGTPITRKLIHEERPLLLSVCRESRQLILKKYQSVFKPPTPSRFLWQYTGSPKSIDLRENLKTLGLVQRGTIRTMPQVITEYMNAYPDEAEKFKNFGTHKDMNDDVICPQWYNPKYDVLFLKTPHRFWRYDKRLWCPWRHEASEVRDLAFELDRLIRVHPSYGRKRAWTNRILRRPGSNNPEIRFDRLSKGVLESVALILKEDCEVIMIRLDETGKLKPDEWSFSLDVESQEFKEQMDTSWSGVTWKVTLGKKEGVGLWSRAAAWKVDNRLWEQDKREICKDKEGVMLLWHIAERSRFFVPTPGRKVQLLPGSDGKTWLGPCVS